MWWTPTHEAGMKHPRQMLEAVALEYGRFKTPRVTARGRDEVARQLIDAARRQGIYVAEDPQLLALLSRLDVGEDIPPELYTAVAVILSWVYWLKGMRPGDEKRTGAEP
jgi:flagellar biosynthesis protein